MKKVILVVKFLFLVLLCFKRNKLVAAEFSKGLTQFSVFYFSSKNLLRKKSQKTWDAKKKTRKKFGCPLIKMRRGQLQPGDRSFLRTSLMGDSLTKQAQCFHHKETSQ